MPYLLDTNIVSHYFRGHPGVLRRLKEASRHEVFISAITTMEIEYGFSLNAESRQRNAHLLERLLEEIQIVGFLSQDAFLAGKIRADLEAKGESIGDFDEMLAATAIAQDLVMVTNNTKHFVRISGLRLEDWTKT
jgi:tRNA(fMet)-specific endonuclease VapC